MTNISVALEIERLIRRAGAYVRLNSLARGRRVLKRKLEGGKTLEVSVSPTGFIRVDLWTPDSVYYARFDSRRELVFGGGKLSGSKEHFVDTAVLTILRVELERNFKGVWRLTPMPIIGELEHYRLVANERHYYF